MDKKTISHYGWVVVVSLVIAVMLAFATPFGEYIGNGVVSIAQGMVGTNSEAVKEENVEDLKDKFSGILNDCTHENTHLVGVKETTCEKDGYTGDLVCKDCLAVLEEGQKQKGTIHEYGTQVVKTPSTCSTQGIAEKTCINCGHIEKVYLETVAHSNFYETGAKAATCTVDGNTPNKLCGVCNAVVEYGQTIKSTGHNVVTTPAVAATCTKSGLTEGSHCSKCNEVIKKQTIIPKAAHAEINGGTAGIHKKCKVCGVTTDTTHSYSMATLGTSTCTEGAIVRSSCNCGYYYDTQLPAKPHTEVTTPAITATCTQKGLSAGKKCSVCNEIIIPQYETSVNPDNHTGSIVNVGTKEIHTKYNCCNKTVSTTHSYTTTNTTATCTTGGTRTNTCSCGYSYTTTTEPLGHNIVANYASTDYVAYNECTRCENIYVPQGAIYYVNTDYSSDASYDNAQKTIVGDGETTLFPETASINDVFKYKDYEYYYGAQYCYGCGAWSSYCGCYDEIDGWAVMFINNTEEPCDILPKIGDVGDVTHLTNTFAYSDIVVAPSIPSSAQDLTSTFAYCYNMSTYKTADDDTANGDFSGYLIPDNVSNMSWTFEECSGMTTTPQLPDTLTNLYATFSYCSGLTTVTNIPQDVVNMDYAFSGCYSITHIPRIADCNKLTSINSTFINTGLVCFPTLPENLTSMNYAFSGCAAYETEDGESYWIYNYIPNKVTSMNGAFQYCNNINYMSIPSSVVKMNYAFYDCLSLEEAHIGVSVTEANYAFYNCDSMYNVYIESEVLQSMVYTFGYCDELYEFYSIPSTVTNMNGTFYYCSNLYDFYPQIPSSVTNMSYTFYNCGNMTSFPTIPSSVTNMSYTFAYSGNTDVNYIDININANPTNTSNCFKGVKTLTFVRGSSTKLTELAKTDGYWQYESGDLARVGVENPMGYNSTYYFAYSNNDGTYGGIENELIGDGGSIPFPATPNQYDMYVEGDYNYIYRAHYTSDPELRLEDDYWAEWGLDGWSMHVNDTTKTGYSVPRTKVGTKDVMYARTAYYNCYYMTSAPKLHEGIFSIQDAYWGCESLKTTPRLPDSIYAMYGAFKYCYSLEYIPNIPSRVTGLYVTFYECYSLKFLPSIHSGVTSFNEAFMYCTSLTGYVDIQASSLESWGSAFYGTEQPIYISSNLGYTDLRNLAATDGYDDMSVYDNVKVASKGTVIETPHSPYDNSQNYIQLGTWNYPNASSVDIMIVTQTESTTYDWISITSGTSYTSGSSYSSTRTYLSTSGTLLSTTGTNANVKHGGTTTQVKCFENVNMKSGSVIFRTDGSVNGYYGAMVIIVPRYETTIETEHSPYSNDINYVVQGTWSYSGAKFVDIYVEIETESTSFDWLSVTAGTDYVSGSSQSATRTYLTTSRTTKSTTGTDSEVKIGGGPLTGVWSTWLTGMNTGTVVFRTDSSVNDYYGGYVKIVAYY